MAARWLQVKLSKIKQERLRKRLARSKRLPDMTLFREAQSHCVRYPEGTTCAITGHDANALAPTLFLNSSLTAPTDRVPPRVAVIRQLMSGDRYQGVLDYQRIVLKNGSKEHLSLFFGANNFIFIEETPTTLSRSIIYTVRERAMFAYRHKCIQWEFTEDLDPD